MTMKIENYEGTADTFTFQHNPQVFDDNIDKFTEQKDYAYAFSYFGTTDRLKNRRIITINGHFDGTNKTSNYQELSKHCSDHKIKKLYFSTDKFYICIPRTCKKTNSGGRTNFIDYAASFTSPFGILFSDTQKSGSYNSTSDSNEGNVATPIEKITVSVTSGNTYNFQDKDGNGFNITVNVTGTLTIYIIKQTTLSADAFFTEYIYADVDGTKQVVSLANSGKSLILQLDSGETLNTRFNSGSANFETGATIYFRDGYSAE